MAIVTLYKCRLLNSALTSYLPFLPFKCLAFGSAPGGAFCRCIVDGDFAQHGFVLRMVAESRPLPTSEK